MQKNCDYHINITNSEITVDSPIDIIPLILL